MIAGELRTRESKLIPPKLRGGDVTSANNVRWRNGTNWRGKAGRRDPLDALDATYYVVEARSYTVVEASIDDAPHRQVWSSKDLGRCSARACPFRRAAPMSTAARVDIP